jgi:hypothetical protein
MMIFCKSLAGKREFRQIKKTALRPVLFSNSPHPIGALGMLGVGNRNFFEPESFIKPARGFRFYVGAQSGDKDAVCVFRAIDQNFGKVFAKVPTSAASVNPELIDVKNPAFLEKKIQMRPTRDLAKFFPGYFVAPGEPDQFVVVEGEKSLGARFTHSVMNIGDNTVDRPEIFIPGRLFPYGAIKFCPFQQGFVR